MPPPGVVRDRGVSQRLRNKTQHLGLSCLPGSRHNGLVLFSPVLRKTRRGGATRVAAVEMSAAAGTRLATWARDGPITEVGTGVGLGQVGGGLMKR